MIYCNTMSMFNFYEQYLTRNEEVRLRDKIRRKCRQEGRCTVWLGERTPDGYGILRVMFRGHRLRLRAHRVMFYLENDFEPMAPSECLSHLCHKKLCVTPDHLVLEPLMINLQHRRCKVSRRCQGHGPYRPCLIGR